MPEKNTALTKARKRLRAWRLKRAEAKAAPHRPAQQQMLVALQGRPLYTGTAQANKVKRRRAKNKVAKRSRKVNRG